MRVVHSLSEFSWDNPAAELAPAWPSQCRFKFDAGWGSAGNPRLAHFEPSRSGLNAYRCLFIMSCHGRLLRSSVGGRRLFFLVDGRRGLTYVPVTRLCGRNPRREPGLLNFRVPRDLGVATIF